MFFVQRAGKVYINYNLGSKDITVGDIATKVNDGKYHVVRFSRSGANSTLQIDDNEPQERFPLGEEDWLTINELLIHDLVTAEWFTRGNKVTKRRRQISSSCFTPR